MLGDKVKTQPMDTMEKNGREADDVGSGWLEVKKKHRSNTKLAMPKNVGASRVRPDTLRKAESDVRKGHTSVPGPARQSPSNIPVCPSDPQKIEDGDKDVCDTKLMPDNKHSENKVHEQSYEVPEENQSLEHLLQFGKIEHSVKSAGNSLEKAQLKDTTALRHHVSDSCMGGSSIVNHESEVLNQSILGSPFTQVPKIKWGNLDEYELEQTQTMGTDSQPLKPQNSDDRPITEDNMPLARSAVCVINKDNSSVMQGNSRVSEDKQEFEISDAPSNNSEISKKDSKEDDFTVCSAKIIGGSESCVQQLDHKSSNVEDFCKAQEEGSIDNALVKREGCGNQLLILDEAEGTPIQETSLSCIQNHHNSLETTMPNKVFVAGEYIQESVSSIDNCEGREYSSEKSCRTELITVTRDTAQSKEDLEVIESINGEKFNKDMRMDANMLINAYEKEETGESKERFRQRLWCFLFENLNRAIDELYLLCELECDVEQMKEAGVVLEEALSDFKELKSRVEGFDKVENLSSASKTFSSATPLNAKIECRRPHALSWEVRRMTSSPHRAEILSSSLEVFKKIQEESAGKNVAHQGKRRDTVYPSLTQSHRENLPAKSPGGRDFRSDSKKLGAKVKGKHAYSSESANQGSMGGKKHTEVTKSSRKNSSELKMAQKSSHLTHPQLTGKKEGNILTSAASSSKVESSGLNSEANFRNARRSELPSSEILVDKNNTAGDPSTRQGSIVDKETLLPALDASKEERNGGDVLASLLQSSSRTILSPIANIISRRKSPLDMKKDVDEKHASARRTRRELENELTQRLQRVSKKLNRVSEGQAERSSKLREGMHARQQCGESRHEAHLAQIARRANDKSSKVTEVQFFTSRKEENKKLSLQKEDITREEAVVERRLPTIAAEMDQLQNKIQGYRKQLNCLQRSVRTMDPAKKKARIRATEECIEGLEMRLQALRAERDSLIVRAVTPGPWGDKNRRVR